jgi:hypothetical protein
MAVSPREVAEEAEEQGFKLIASNRDCPCWWEWLGMHKLGADCAAKATEKGLDNFVWYNPTDRFTQTDDYWFNRATPCYGNDTGKYGVCECDGDESSQDYVQSNFDFYVNLNGPKANKEGDVSAAPAMMLAQMANSKFDASKHIRNGTPEQNEKMIEADAERHHKHKHSKKH